MLKTKTRTRFRLPDAKPAPTWRDFLISELRWHERQLSGLDAATVADCTSADWNAQLDLLCDVADHCTLLPADHRAFIPLTVGYTPPTGCGELFGTCDHTERFSRILLDAMKDTLDDDQIIVHEALESVLRRLRVALDQHHGIRQFV